MTRHFENHVLQVERQPRNSSFMDSPATAGIIRKQHITEFGQVVQVVYGDIYADRVDAIVNGEANSQIVLGGSELLKRGGSAIQKECTAWVKEHGKLDDVSKVIITFF